MLDLGLLAPVQFLPQHGEIAIARGVQQTDTELRASDAQGVSRLQVKCHLTIKIDARIRGANDAHLDFVAIADYDWPIRKGMRTKRHERNTGHARMNDRTIG